MELSVEDTKLNKDDFDIGRVGEWESYDDFFVGIQWLKSRKEGEGIRDQILQDNESLAHIREWVDIMKDEPEEWIKLSEVYHSLKRMLGDEE